MTIQDLGSIGELVAALATVVTLAYLAIQIRQNTASLRTAAELDLSQQIAMFHARISAQPDLARIWDAAASDFESLGPDEVRRLRWLVAELFLIYEGQYQVFRSGHINEMSWGAKRDVMLGLLENPKISEWWENRMTPFSEEFFREIEKGRGRNNLTWKHQTVGSEPTLKDREPR